MTPAEPRSVVETPLRFFQAATDEAARVQPAPRVPLVLRLAAWASRRRYGRVLAVIPYVYAWLPGLVLPNAGLVRLATRLPLAPRLRRLVEVHVSAVNGCSFCGDMHAALAIEQGEAPGLIAGLADFRASDQFTAAEKSALAWVEEVTRSRGTGSETLPSLRAHFGDREIVALSWLASFVTYLNILAKSRGLGSQGLCEVVIGRRAPKRSA